MGTLKQKGFNTRLLPLKNLLYGLSYAPDNNEKIYYFLLVDVDKEQAFRAALNSNKPFNIKDYATVIASGQGDPPDDIKEQLLIKYNAIL